MPAQKRVVWFSEVDKNDVPLVGGKAANLGEMVQAGFPVPNGFVVTSDAYFQFLKENNLTLKIKHLLNTTNFDHPESLSQVSAHIKKAIVEGEINNELILEIYNYYKKLSGVFSEALVAVRSSATAEDLPGASFAGQQETYLNVKGEAHLILSIKKCWASLFDARAIFYRHEGKYDHFKVGIAVPVQKMVESEQSGVMFTLDPITNDKSKVIIEAIYGLGEMIVQGEVNPDHYEVSKKDHSITLKTIADQKIKLEKKGSENKTVKVSYLKSHKQKISDGKIKELAKLGIDIEKHYFFPQDIEWAIEKGKVFIVQSRPVTTISKKDKPSEKFEEPLEKNMILKGEPASPGIISGSVKILKDASEIGRLTEGEILVAPETNPDFVPAMKKASGIVTDFGGRTSHAAIVSREIGIPAVVGTKNATKVLKDNMVITINGGTGEVFKGGVSPLNSSSRATVEEHIKTATKVYVNLAEPEFASKIAAKNVDGVGLLRAEFMMAGIGTHPKKMIRDGKANEYVEKLSEGLKTFCEAFNPRPVVYRASDFKTNEYRNLVGGKDFEPEEPNPMLGFRGAFRYIRDNEVFKLELEAIKRVRNKHGLKNLWLMIPFVRTVNELLEVKKIIGAENLHRSPTFKLWMMVEIPSNVILLDEFIEAGIDGISVGTNDLTMLLLGTDRDNSEVAKEFDERNEAVSWALEKIVKTAHKHGITSSVCGQSVSTYQEILEHVVRLGITSVSVSPDVVDKTREMIFDVEEKLVQNK